MLKVSSKNGWVLDRAAGAAVETNVAEGQHRKEHDDLQLERHQQRSWPCPPPKCSCVRGAGILRACR